MTLPAADPSLLTPRPWPSVAVKSLVVFRALRVGDMLCAVPALRALRAGFPGASITLVGLPWAAQFAARFRCYVDEFIAFPGHPAFPEQPADAARLPGFYAAMQARHFDLVVQMHGNGEVSNTIVQAFGARAVAGFATCPVSPFPPARFFRNPLSGPEPLRLLQLAEQLGAPVQGTQLEFPLTAEDEAELQASGVAAGLEPGRYVCLHPGAAHRDKCWPVERFAAVADQLAADSGLVMVLTGSAAEADLTSAVARRMRQPAVDTARPLSLGAMAALMSGARLLICNDTGVSHIAAGLRLPSVVVFSRADPQRWAPLDRRLHRCIRDPQGTRAWAVLEAARSQLGINRNTAGRR